MENVRNIQDEKISSAQSSVDTSINRFEESLERLTHRLDRTHQSFDRIRNAIRKPFDVASDVKNSLKKEYENFTPYFRAVQDYSNRVVSSVRANPRPYVIALVGVIAVALAAVYFSDRDEIEKMAAA